MVESSEPRGSATSAGGAGAVEGAARHETGDGRVVVEGPLKTSGKGRSVTENVDEI